LAAGAAALVTIAAIRIEEPLAMTDVQQNPAATEDVAESIVHSIPVVIPVLGGLMIFLLAFIAVTMA